jgi:uncharacterized membrane protein YdfJ with MMPL/SSD domain
MHIDAIFGAIGRWCVRFRWLVLLVWVIGAIGAATQLPALSSVTQSNNDKFLPASAQSQHAIDLAAPFGNSNSLPIPVIAASAAGPLTATQVSALNSLQTDLKSVHGVQRVLDVGRSADNQAEQLLVLAANNSGTWSTGCARRSPRPGCLAGCTRTWPATSLSRWTSRRRQATPATR